MISIFIIIIVTLLLFFGVDLVLNHKRKLLKPLLPPSTEISIPADVDDLVKQSNLVEEKSLVNSNELIARRLVMKQFEKEHTGIKDEGIVYPPDTRFPNDKGEFPIMDGRIVEPNSIEQPSTYSCRAFETGIPNSVRCTDKIALRSPNAKSKNPEIPDTYVEASNKDGYLREAEFTNEYQNLLSYWNYQPDILATKVYPFRPTVTDWKNTAPELGHPL